MITIDDIKSEAASIDRRVIPEYYLDIAQDGLILRFIFINDNVLDAIAGRIPPQDLEMSLGDFSKKWIAPSISALMRGCD